MNIFVYGTLKKGFKGNFLLKNCEHIGDIETKPLYKLFTNEHYPCMKKDTPGKSIRGELYDANIDTIKELNEYEGVDQGLFSLSVVELDLNSLSNNQKSIDSELCLGYLFLGNISYMREIPFWGELDTYEHSKNRP